MSTRSLTIILNEEGDEIVVMYRQMDGYIEGHGVDLAEFLKDMHIVNGISMAETRVIANGMGCLSAQIVAHFKNGAGGIYLYKAGTRDCGEDYVYFITPDLKIKCEDADSGLQFEGTAKQLLKKYK